jgi:hypothetical protein
MSRDKNVSKEPVDPSSKLKFTLKKDGADSTKLLLFLDTVLYVAHDAMNTGTLITMTTTNTINVIEL